MQQQECDTLAVAAGVCPLDSHANAARPILLIQGSDEQE
jgi:hypothetical protein